MDSDDKDDSQDDGHQGSGQVVGDGSPPDSAREGHVQGPHGCYEGRDNQRKDESFQHPEEDLANVGDIHHLPLMPVLLALPEDEAEDDPADDAAHGGDSEGVHPQTFPRFLHAAHPERGSVRANLRGLGGPHS